MGGYYYIFKIGESDVEYNYLTLSRILLLYLDDDTDEVDDEEKDDNLILSPPTMVNGLEGWSISQHY